MAYLSPQRNRYQSPHGYCHDAWLENQHRLPGAFARGVPAQREAIAAYLSGRRAPVAEARVQLTGSGMVAEN